SYISAALSSINICSTIKVIGRDSYVRELRRAIKKPPKAIGISATGYQIGLLLEVVRFLKNMISVPIVCGGYCSLAGEELARASQIDVIVHGEGELTASELFRELINGNTEKLEHIQGISFLKNGEYIRTANRPLIDRLDTIPVPRQVQRNVRLLERIKLSRPTYFQLVSSRGCSAECTFCFINKHYGTACVREHSTNYIRNIIRLNNKRISRFVHFHDDDLLSRKHRLDEISEISNDYDFLFGFETKVANLLRYKDEILRNKDRIIKVELGIESYHEAALRRWRKPQNPALCSEAINILSENKINYQLDLIINDKETTDEEFITNMEELKRLPPNHYLYMRNNGNYHMYRVPASIIKSVRFNSMLDLYGKPEHNAHGDNYGLLRIFLISAESILDQMGFIHKYDNISPDGKCFDYDLMNRVDSAAVLRYDTAEEICGILKSTRCDEIKKDIVRQYLVGYQQKVLEMIRRNNF
ncbi:MAG: radical SAM protein, partial [Thermoplasmata archaeon]|nr:radical SAM protein [Thermoplasmata archaeon]